MIADDEQATTTQAAVKSTAAPRTASKDPKGLSFSSSSGAMSGASKGTSRKRKGVGSEVDASDAKGEDQVAGKKVKREKKQAQSKALISFGDE